MDWLGPAIQTPIVLWILLAIVLFVVGRFFRSILEVVLHGWLWLIRRRDGE